jgi:hypothetical protein
MTRTLTSAARNVIIRGSGNVFADLGFADAEERQTKLRLACEGFSVERLMTLLTALDRDVEIVIRKKPRSRSVARISVVAA